MNQLKHLDASPPRASELGLQPRPRLLDAWHALFHDDGLNGSRAHAFRTLGENLWSRTFGVASLNQLLIVHLSSNRRLG